VEMVIAKESLIKKIIGRHYESKISYDQVLEDLDEAGKKDRLDDSKKEDIIVVDEEALEDAPVIRLVNLILMDAIKKGASDIHIEPYEKSYRVRTRIDGVLYDVMQPPLKFKDAISSRIKIMSYLDIAERRLPQDGRIKIKTSRNKEMEFRVSVLPTVFGEKIVLRLLDKSALQVDMTKLGFDIESLEGFQKNIHKPYGMVLVTGPTGSGKTTTLYSALDELNSPEVNISTAEDPVEFTLPGVNQVHVNEEVGLNFAASLRSFLRQDPDIIMVGEIRDFETAEIAIKAALTGHLVLSTLHTNDASSTIHRLLNMGVEPFMVVASVNVVVAQRLARRICPDCKHKTEIPIQSLIELGFEEQDAKKLEYYTGSGCANCSGTGYKGRTGLYEVMPMTDNLRDSVMNGASVGELKQEAIREGMFTIRQSGLKKIKQGFTTIDEVLRVSAAD